MFDHSSGSLSYKDIPALIWKSCMADPLLSKVSFSNMRPQEVQDTPAIIWQGKGYKPGNQHLATGRRGIIGPVQFFQVPSKDGQYMNQIYFQRFTGVINFDCVTSSSEEGYDLTEAFQAVVMSNMPEIKRNGIVGLILQSVDPEWMLERRGVQLYVKPMRYEIVWNRTITTAVQRIRDITSYQLTRLRKIDIPIVRGEGTYDIIEEKNIELIDYGFDDPHLSLESITSSEIPEEWEPYVAEVDFTYSTLNNGYTKLEWSPKGHSPEQGATYYLSYWYLK